MPNYLIRRLVILGCIAIIGIVGIQSYWLAKNWDIQDEQFDTTVNIMLRKVANKLSVYNRSELPKQGLVQRKSSNTYAVNVNSAINARVLEDLLFQEMDAHSLKTDFEYAVFDCFNDELVYGNYCELEDQLGNVAPTSLPTFDDLIYYFVVRFPNREGYLLSNIWLNVLFSIIAILAVLFFMYAIWVILKQKRLSELQKDFINNMTHEFKTPISSIKIAAEVLAKNESILSDPRLKKYTSIITHQNTRLNDQVEKVLNIARIEKGTFELKKENFSVQKELQHIIHQEQAKLHEGTIGLTLPNEDVQIKADRLHFTNVITNLLDNAVKYTKETPKIQVKARVDQNRIRIDIVDNGIGISAEDQKRLFEKFFRVSTGDLHDVKGFGLGLFYVKNIADAHGWEIAISSKLNEGTRFSIFIPIITTQRA